MSENIYFVSEWLPVGEYWLNSDSTGTIAAGQDSLFYNAGFTGSGVVLSGWEFSATTESHGLPVNPMLVGRDSAGRFVNLTSELIQDPWVNSTGATLVADFNNDGNDDIFFAPLKESPTFAPALSFAFISNRSTFDKISVGPPITAHGGQVVYIDDEPKILVTVTPGPNAVSYEDQYGAGGNLLFSWNGSDFDSSETYEYSYRSPLDAKLVNSGMDSQVLFRDDLADYILIRADQRGVLGDESQINVYSFDGESITSPVPLQSITPYLSTLDRYENVESLWGSGLTHTYRLAVADINSDGSNDLLAFQSMWNGLGEEYPSAIQILQSHDSPLFVDMTEALMPNINLLQDEVAYGSAKTITLDDTGIPHLATAAGSSSLFSRNPTYLMLNDGTGQFHISLHEEFDEWSEAVYTQLGWPGTNRTANFVASPDENGDLDYLIIAPFERSEQEQTYKSYEIYGLDLNYDPEVNFTENVLIQDRNQSRQIKTWAGDDRVEDLNPSVLPTVIDGGDGIDTVSYQSVSSLFVRNPSGYQVGRDNLINIERIEFSDVSLALDFDRSAGQTAKTLAAVIGEEGLSNKEYVGIGLSLFDAGQSLATVCELALTAVGATTNEDIVNLLYTNLYGEAPTADVAQPFIDALNNGGFTKGSLAAAAAELTDDLGVIDLVGLAETGIEYI